MQTRLLICCAARRGWCGDAFGSHRTGAGCVLVAPIAGSCWRASPTMTEPPPMKQRRVKLRNTCEACRAVKVSWRRIARTRALR